MPSHDPRCLLLITATNDAPSDAIWETAGPVFPFSFYFLTMSYLPYLTASCWLLCDYIDEIHDEVEYIWKRPMCVGSALFFAVRYVGIACLCFSFATAAWPRRLFAQYHCDTPSTSHLHIFALNRDMDALAYRLTPVLQFLVFWLVQVIMQMRIHALYMSRALRVANGALFLAQVAAMLLLWHFAPSMLRATREAQYAAVAAGDATPLEAFPEVALIFWAPGMAFDLWLAGLAAAKLRQRSAVLKRDLLSVLLNDSLMYFLLVAGHMILHVVLTVYVHGSYVTPLFIVGSTVGGSRLLSHLRKAYYGRQDGIAVGASQCAMSFAIPTQETAGRGGGIVDASFFDDENPGPAETLNV